MIIARIRVLLAAGLLLCCAGTAGGMAATPATLWLRVGHSLLLGAQGLRRVAVGNSRIAVVVPVGTSQLIVNGKAAGKTSIVVWTQRGRTDYAVTVTR